MSRDTSLRPNGSTLEGHAQTVAVVGATGTIGSRVARALADAGHEVVGLSRTPAQTASYRVSAVDLRNEAAAEAALAGADVVYITPPEGGANPLGDERAVVLNRNSRRIHMPPLLANLFGEQAVFMLRRDQF